MVFQTNDTLLQASQISWIKQGLEGRRYTRIRFIKIGEFVKSDL
jgi:hypothetical protein